MTLRFSKELLEQLIGRPVPPEAAGIEPVGIASNLAQISGGELYLASSAKEADAAIERGSAFAIYDSEESSALKTCSRVQDCDVVLRRIAKHVRARTNARVVVLYGASGLLQSKELLAKLLLSTGRGIATLHTNLNERTELTSFCSLGEQHEWVILAVGSEFKEVRRLLEILAPDVVVVPSLLTKTTQIGFGQFLPNAIVLEQKRGEALVEFQIGEHGMLTLASIESDGFAPLVFTASYCDETVIVRTNIVSSLGIEAVMAAISVSLHLSPTQSLVDIAKACARFQPAVARPLKHVLGDGRIVVDASGLQSLQELERLMSLCEMEVSQRQATICFVVGELASLKDKELQSFGASLAKLDCLCVAYVGARAELALADSKAAQIPAFSCDTAESAAHTVGKVAFSMLVVVGPFDIGLDRVVETLIYSFGETMEVPTSAQVLDNSEE